MPGEPEEEFYLTIYLDSVTCNRSEDFGGDEFVITGVSQSGRTHSEFDKANRTIKTDIIKTKTGGGPYSFPQTSATLFAQKVKPSDYVLVSVSARDLDFSETAWKEGVVELSEALTAVAKKAADKAFYQSRKPGGGGVGRAGNLVDGNILEAAGKVVLEQIPEALKAVFKLDAPDNLGEWYPPRGDSQARNWAAKAGDDLHIPLKGTNIKGPWDYDLVVGITVEDV